MKTTVIYHSADFDGLFCREIARRFIPDAEPIGWDFGDEPLIIPDGSICILDLPVDRVFGFKYDLGDVDKNPPQHPAGLVWIDHHASSIATHPSRIPGYRIDGVAACRLAWQWFSEFQCSPPRIVACDKLPFKQDFVDRTVKEPLSVRLAGEYDIWDKRDPRAELFQHGLKSQPLNRHEWRWLLEDECDKSYSESFVATLLKQGEMLQYVRDQEYLDVITQQGFDLEFEGLKFLACCSHELDIRSQLFAEGIKPHHEALLGFTFTGKDWRVSMYHAPGKESHDLSLIAVKHGGGGHRGACGFRAKHLPFLEAT